jgi:hypothetical protein
MNNLLAVCEEQAEWIYLARLSIFGNHALPVAGAERNLLMEPTRLAQSLALGESGLRPRNCSTKCR